MTKDERSAALPLQDDLSRCDIIDSVTVCVGCDPGQDKDPDPDPFPERALEEAIE